MSSETCGPAPDASQIPPDAAPPLRVLHVIAGLGPGGAETMLYRLVSHMRHVDHRVISFAPPDVYSERLAAIGVPVEHLGVRSLASTARALWRLARVIRRTDADVVQGWMYRSNLVAGLIARTARIPAVWGIHCASLEPLRFTARLFAYASGAVAGWVPAYVINCSARSVLLHDRLGFGRAPGGVVHNGYDPDAFRPDAAAGSRLRRSLDVPEGTLLLGCVSRWHAEKDIPNLLDALRILTERGRGEFRCLLVGHELDPGNAALMAAVTARGLERSVLPLGRRSDIADIMRAIDIHVLPSRSEAFPNVVAEAMLSGTPCIVTDAGDAPLMVGETGWVAPPADPVALADRIDQAWVDAAGPPERWEARCSAARRRIADNFSIDRMASEYEAVWRSAAASKRPRGEQAGTP